ncbi:LysM peptidoglycan-binding domain-containing protein [Azoarcus sp. DN11]|uniref:LysM peptidoglycan-binding domain-containing protein n=1 Tax=Azoarcus sp. DN11 TaxID=356837 RepID=UPI000EB53F0E|nr:LysM peptidoglycan-binding domain-containing protein [Azoarcus sp. DN11]AYH41832.1 peptidoglycan-binding protein [Azoarcus sp. DN11]
MTRIIFPLLFSVATLLGTPALAAPAALADDAPDSHTVVRGDTLWGISGKFLKEPWRWPEVWRLNREQIRNPHLIYPGQVIVLDRSGPYLSIGRRVGDQKLEPQVYQEDLKDAISSIPTQDIEPFLTKPLVIDEARLADAGTVVATETSRVFMGPGDTIFAKNIREDQKVWQVLRPAKPLVDPVTGEVLGYEAAYLGAARVTANGTPATLEILSAVEEIGTGDRLVASDKPEVFSFVPHAPVADVAGRLIGIYRGVSETGRNHVVTLNVGTREGVDRGTVLALHRNRGSVVYKDDDGNKESFVLPEKRYGLAFVFRVFNRVSYALVMETDGQVAVGDSVRKP